MDRRSRVVVAALALSCLAWSATAAAQERTGFWFDVDLGAGSVGLSSDVGDSSRTWGAVGRFGAGWAVNPQLLAGFEMGITTLDVSGDLTGTLDVYNVMGRVAYYPSPSKGLFVKGAVGGSFLDLNIEDRGTTLTANVSSGLGLGAGVGYDVYLGRGFSLTPGVSYWYGRTGDVKIFGETLFADWSHNVVDLTIGLSFH